VFTGVFRVTYPTDSEYSDLKWTNQGLQSRLTFMMLERCIVTFWRLYRRVYQKPDRLDFPLHEMQMAHAHLDFLHSFLRLDDKMSNLYMLPSPQNAVRVVLNYARCAGRNPWILPPSPLLNKPAAGFACAPPHRCFFYLVLWHIERHVAPKFDLKA